MVYKTLADEEIEQMKSGFKYSLARDYPYNKKPYNPTHRENDRIRAAFEWLDAQKKTKTINRRHYPVKHLIEEWACFYVSRDDVEVAAALHKDVRGEYPYFNISKSLTFPNKKRLENIKIENEGYGQWYEDRYSKKED